MLAHAAAVFVRQLFRGVDLQGYARKRLGEEVVLSFRRRSANLEAYKIADYLVHFPRRDAIEQIIYEEVF